MYLPTVQHGGNFTLKIIMRESSRGS